MTAPGNDETVPLLQTCGYEFGECASAYSAPHECALDTGHRWSLHTCGCGEQLPRRLGFRIYFDFNDWWIGYYRGEAHHYICPLPSLVFRFNRTPLHARSQGGSDVGK